MADDTLIQPEGDAPESTQPADETTTTEATTSPTTDGFGDDLSLDTPVDAPAEAQPTDESASEAAAEPEAGPSGGDGTQGTELPAAEPAIDTPAEVEPDSTQGEGAQASGDEAVVLADSESKPSEPTQSADEVGASSEPSADDKAAESATEPGDSAGDAEASPSQASAQEPIEAPAEAASADLPPQDSEAAAAVQKAGEQDKTPAQVAWEAQNANPSLPPPETSDCISDGSIPQASHNDAPTSTAVAGGETVMGPIPEALPASTQADTATTATPSPETTDTATEAGKDGGETALVVAPTDSASTLFGGRAGPSPLPEVADKDLLPHPALSAQSPGFISGTTQETQAALPVPGKADVAEGTAAAISGTASGAAADTGATAEQGVEAAEAKASDASDAGSEATAALPVAASVTETFKTLSDDGKAIFDALSKVQDSIGDVIALEFKTLANVAAHISSRLDEAKHKLSEPEQRTKLVTVANQVIELLESLEGLFGESASDAPLSPDVEKVIGSLGELGESARKSLFA